MANRIIYYTEHVKVRHRIQSLECFLPFMWIYCVSHIRTIGYELFQLVSMEEEVGFDMEERKN